MHEYCSTQFLLFSLFVQGELERNTTAEFGDHGADNQECHRTSRGPNRQKSGRQRITVCHLSDQRIWHSNLRLPKWTALMNWTITTGLLNIQSASIPISNLLLEPSPKSQRSSGLDWFDRSWQHCTSLEKMCKLEETPPEFFHREVFAR